MPRSPVGLSLGTWTGSACQVVIANDNALQGAIVTGTVTSAASLCVRIYDIGKVTSAAELHDHRRPPLAHRDGLTPRMHTDTH